MFGKYLHIVSLFFLFTACAKKEMSATQIIGHAGNGLTVPHSIYTDNTQSSIELAISHVGCDGVELDVQMDKDGNLWLFHDETMERTSLSEGSIPDYTTAELSAAHYRSFMKEPLVQLKDYVLHWTNGKMVFFNPKIYHQSAQTTVDVDQFISRLIELRNQTSAYQYAFITNNLDFSLRLKAEQFMVYYDVENAQELNYAVNHPDTWDGVCLSYKLVHKGDVDHLKNLGLAVALSGIRSPKAVKLSLGMKPDYIIVDDLKTAITEKY